MTDSLVKIKSITNLAEHSEAGHFLHEHPDKLYSSLSNAYDHLTEHMEESSHIDGAIWLHTQLDGMQWVEVIFATEDGIAYTVNNFYPRRKACVPHGLPPTNVNV